VANRPEPERLEVVQRLLDAAQAASNADASSSTAEVLDRMIEQIKAAFGSPFPQDDHAQRAVGYEVARYTGTVAPVPAAAAPTR
jgi:hypothetical protein